MNSKNRLVVKDNALIEASFNLSLVEQRLMLLAIVEARELEILTPETPIEIKAIAYKDQYKTDKSEAYKQLADASKQLFSRQFSYLDKYSNVNAVTVSRWVNEVTYVHEKGMVVIYLNRNVISMISRLETDFTQYLLKQVSDFKSKYSIRLYEILIKYKNIGNSQKYSINDIRSLLGVETDEYKLISDLKKRVIDTAIKDINDTTDITVSYEQFKQGRTITHLLFKMKQKHTKQKKQAEKVISFTEKQLDMFSDKLSKLPSFQNHYLADTGVSTEEYAQQIKAKLSEPSTVKQWIPYLNEVGYKGI